MNRSSSAATTGAGNGGRSTSTATSVPVAGGPLHLPSGHLVAHMSEAVPPALRSNTAYTSSEKLEYGLGTHTQYTADVDIGDRDQASRYLLVCEIISREMADEAAGGGVLNAAKSTVKGIVGVKKDPVRNDYFLRFDNILDSHDALQALEEKAIMANSMPVFHVSFTPPLSYHQLRGCESPVFTDFEAEVNVVVRLRQAGNLPFTKSRIRSSVKRRATRELQSQIGGVWKIELVFENPMDFTYHFRVEMDSVTMADKAVRVYGVAVEIVHSIETPETEPFFVDGTMQVSYAVLSQDPQDFLEMSPVDNFGSPLNIELYSNGENVNYHNMVILDRILRGIDHRTTVMLRNIPNKLGMFDVTRLLNAICPGRFDFAYLRVDFQNQCNVGYAFINFDNPMDIVNFFLDVSGHRWNVFNTEKIAQVCYATIQGKEALVDRFRNSGVNAQWTPFRAQLFYTESDDVPAWMHGENAPFPSPNNQGRLQRSLQNVRQVGLFPPRNNGNNNHRTGRRGGAPAQPRGQGN